MVILDTDHLSLLERRDLEETIRLQARLSELGSELVWTTIVCVEEQLRGWMAYLAKSSKLIQQIEAYRRLVCQLDNYRTFQILGFEAQTAAEFQRLKKSVRRIGTMDLKIAATALTHNATLLSRNLRDFRRIPGLRVEDWTS